MNFTYLHTPKKANVPIRLQKTKRFTRKPMEKSERSLSRKSSDHLDRKQIYIKTPTSMKKEEAGGPEASFFEALAESLLPTAKKEPSTRGGNSRDPKSSLSTSRCLFQNHTLNSNNEEGPRKIQSLRSELEMKSHQLSVLAGECQRMKIKLAEETEKRKKYDEERHSLKGQLKDAQKISDNKVRRLETEKQQLSKHLKAVEAIVYKKEEREMQSYRERILQEEINNLRQQLKKTRGNRQEELEKRMKRIQDENYCLKSHLKVINIENECLHRQISQHNDEDLVINSEIYQKVHQKYKKLMEQFIKVRSENDRLAALVQRNGGNESNNSSDVFSITASEVEKDLSLIRQSNTINESNSSFTINLAANQTANKGRNYLQQ